jgi:hypothetical protein
MPVSIRCGVCNAKSKIPDELYQTRFAGRRSTIRCKKCSAQIEVDALQVADGDLASIELLAAQASGPRTQSAASLRAVELSAASAGVNEDQLDTLSKLVAETTLSVPALDTKPANPDHTGSDAIAVVTQQPPVKARDEKHSRRGRWGGAVYGLVAASIVAGVALFLVSAKRPTSESEVPRPRPATAIVEKSQTFESSTGIPHATEKAPEVLQNGPPEVLAANDSGHARVPAPESPVAASYDQKALERALRWFSEQAEGCHRGGRAAGTAKLVVTFGTAGKVVAAHIEGEPIASAPVARCILSYARSMLLPRFEGQSVTVTREFTLR